MLEWQGTSCQAPGLLGPSFGELRADTTCADRTEGGVSGGGSPAVEAVEGLAGSGRRLYLGVLLLDAADGLPGRAVAPILLLPGARACQGHWLQGLPQEPGEVWPCRSTSSKGCWPSPWGVGEHPVSVPPRLPPWPRVGWSSRCQAGCPGLGRRLKKRNRYGLGRRGNKEKWEAGEGKLRSLGSFTHLSFC